tara:strand:- start:36754 stop:36870 length:117 start_codon:yes stop_codon:yes gene_type:complete
LKIPEKMHFKAMGVLVVDEFRRQRLRAWVFLDGVLSFY